MVAHLGAHPDEGAVILETGGVRKLRWALPGRGKSGGARVIYYFHSERMPLFLLAMYGKNERANLSAAKRPTVGQRIVEGLDEAIAWSQGEKTGARVTLGTLPALRFGLPPGTLRNWEQGRSVPDAPSRVLLAVIAKHPEAVDDCFIR